MSVRLVITADDLGHDRGTNETIVGLLADGSVTATTLLTVAPDAEHAVDLLAGTGVQPAVHIALTADTGQHWAALSGAPGLSGPQGWLPFSAADLADVDESTVRAELVAQWQWAVDHGLSPERIDSHAGTLYGLTGPSFLRATMSFCAEHGLGFRLPRSLDPYPGALPEPMAARHAAAVAGADALGVRIPTSIRTLPGGVEEIGDYTSLRAAYLSMINGLGPGVHELFLHPSVDTPALRAGGPGWRKRVWEHRLLRDPLWQQAITDRDIELVPGW
ncbi:MAG: carbohydrate deacetylase [Propionibacteriaceae bacterium]